MTGAQENGRAGVVPEFVPLPARGRRYTQHRRVGLGDVDPSARVRLDALAAYVQDIATADAEDADLGDIYAWVLRRHAVRLDHGAAWPHVGDRLELTTFCGGVGSRWAERRTVIRSAAGTVDVVALWVAIDARGRPMRLTPQFFERYGEAAGGRQVMARLTHSDPPPTASVRPWPLRRADLDTLGHVNNAAHWQAVEEALAGRAPSAAAIEFRSALEHPGPAELMVEEPPPASSASERHDATMRTWLVADGAVRSSAVLAFD